MSVTRIYTPNRVGNVLIRLGPIPVGRDYVHRWTLEDWDSATGTSLGLKNFAGGAGFSLQFTRPFSRTAVPTSADWILEVGGVLDGPAAEGRIAFPVRAADTIALQDSGYSRGYVRAVWVDPNGNKLELENGVWDLHRWPQAPA